MREHKDELAGVIVEPFQRIIPPVPGFLEGLRKITAENGVLLIFDEVVTGFRLAYGGAQEYYGVVPDLCTLGKVIGGGFPLAAIAGRAEIMAHFDRGAVGDDGFLMQVGTCPAIPVAAAAGLATLEILRRPGAYERLFATGRELMGTLAELLKAHGVTAQVTGEPPLFDVVFSAEPVRDYRGTLRGDAEMLRRFNALLRERGILKGESEILRVARPHAGGHPAHPRRLGLGDRDARRRLSLVTECDLCEAVAASAELGEQPSGFVLGQRALLGHHRRHPFRGHRLAFAFAGHHRINPAGPPFDNGKTGRGSDQKKRAVLLDDRDRSGWIVVHCRRSSISSNTASGATSSVKLFDLAIDLGFNTQALGDRR